MNVFSEIKCYLLITIVALTITAPIVTISSYYKDSKPQIYVTTIYNDIPVKYYEIDANIAKKIYEIKYKEYGSDLKSVKVTRILNVDLFHRIIDNPSYQVDLELNNSGEVNYVINKYDLS